MKEHIFCIHVSLSLFEKAMDEESYNLKILYSDPLFGMVQVELLDDLVQEYYKKFYLELISGENAIDLDEESYEIPIGLRRIENGLELLSVTELIENSVVDTLEAYPENFEVNGVDKEFYVIAFPKEPMISALFTRESLISHLGSVGKIRLSSYDIEEVLNNDSDSNSEDYIPLVFEVLKSKELTLVGIYLEALPYSGREKAKIKRLRDRWKE